MEFVIEWDNAQQSERISSPDDLDSILDRIAEQRGVDGLPFIVDLYQPGVGDGFITYGLQFGVGHPERTRLEWSGPPLAAAGIEPGIPSWDGPEIAFDYGHVPTEEDPNWLRVTPGTARRAAREYVETGLRPDCVDWARD
jgi:hypothetical protein